MLAQQTTELYTAFNKFIYIKKKKKIKYAPCNRYCSVPITVNEGQLFTADASTSVSIVRCYF